MLSHNDQLLPHTNSASLREVLHTVCLQDCKRSSQYFLRALSCFRSVFVEDVIDSMRLRRWERILQFEATFTHFLSTESNLFLDVRFEHFHIANSEAAVSNSWRTFISPVSAAPSGQNACVVARYVSSHCIRPGSVLESLGTHKQEHVYTLCQNSGHTSEQAHPNPTNLYSDKIPTVRPLLSLCSHFLGTSVALRDSCPHQRTGNNFYRNRALHSNSEVHGNG